MTIQIRDADSGVAVVEIAGRLTLGDACQLLLQKIDELLRANKARVVLEVGQLEFMDSAGLGTVVACYSKAKKAGGNLVLAAPQKKVFDTFKITHMDSVVKSFPTAEAAAQSFQNPPAPTPPPA
jgi:anti-sigma B factor antagonist